VAVALLPHSPPNEHDLNPDGRRCCSQAGLPRDLRRSPGGIGRGGRTPEVVAASEKNKVPDRNPARVATPRNLHATAIGCVAVLCLISSCSSAPVAADGSARLAAERVVLPEDFGHVLDVRVGDMLAVRPPMTASEWQVMYDDSYLEFQGTREQLRSPDTSGWKFNVLRAGETPLTVTPVMRGGPNPPRFTVTFHVE